MQKTLHSGTSWSNRSKEYQERARKNAREAGLISNYGRGPTNHEFASQNETFKADCEAAGVKPTQRQASKYRRGLGRAAQPK